MYLNLPCNAFQTTLATYAGQNIGAGKLDRVNLGVRQTIIWWNGLFGFGMGFLISWIYYISGRWKRNSAIAEG